MTQPDTLHTRLAAEINRRRAVARAAVGPPYDALSQSWSRSWVIAWLEGELEVLERHAPYPVSGGIGCDHCTRLCHSRSGLGCDSPDAPYPCDEIRSLAHRLEVNVDG